MAKRARITFHDGKTATVHFAEGMSDEQKKAEVTKIEQDYLKKYPAPQKEEGGGEERTWGEFAQDTAEFLGMTDGKRDEGDEGMKAFPEAFEEHAPKATMHGAGPYGAKGVTADMKAAGKLHTGGVDTGAGALTTVTNEAQGDVYEAELKREGRFVGRTKDEQGNEIIQFKDDAGNVQEAYVNEPEWSGRDVAKIAGQTAPNMLAAGAIAPAVVGMGATRAGLIHGVGQVATEFARDDAAALEGSKQGIDYLKAGAAGVGGAAGEWAAAAIGKYVSSTSGRAVVKKLHRGEKLKASERGNLKKFLVRELKKEGRFKDGMVDDVMGIDEFVDDFQRNSEGLSVGQITGDEKMLKAEAGQRKMGQGNVAETADELSDEKTLQQVLGGRNVDDAINPDIEEKIARTDMAADEPSMFIQERLNKARETARLAEKEKWDVADAYALEPERVERTIDLKPEEYKMEGLTGLAKTKKVKAFSDNAYENIDNHLSENLGSRTGLLPRAKEAYKELDYFVRHGELKPDPDMTIHTPRAGMSSLEGMRRRLRHFAESAAPGDERASALAIERSFNDWVDDLADEGALKLSNGKTGKEILALFEKARSYSRTQRSLFNPRPSALKKGNLKDPVGGQRKAQALLDRIFDTDRVTSQEFAQALFNKPGQYSKEGSLIAVDHILDVGRVHEIPGMRGELQKAYIANILAPGGKVVEPEKVLVNIQKVLSTQKDMVEKLGLRKELHRIAHRSSMIARGRMKGDEIAQLPKSLRVPGLSYKTKAARMAVQWLWGVHQKAKVANSMAGRGARGNALGQGRTGRGRGAAIGASLNTQNRDKK